MQAAVSGQHFLEKGVNEIEEFRHAHEELFADFEVQMCNMQKCYLLRGGDCCCIKININPRLTTQKT